MDEYDSGGHPGTSLRLGSRLTSDSSRYTTPSAIQVLPVSSILAENSELIGRIKLCYGVDRQTFERDLLPLISGYAAYVHLLPATPAGFFSEPGGLLRMGLETGLYSLQGTDGHIFAGRSTISVRRQLEPRWRLATFIAGMCAELHRAMTQVTALTSQDHRWPAYLAPLWTWLADQRAQNYYVQWDSAKQMTRSTGLLAIAMVVPQPVIAYLAQHNHSIVPQLLQCVGGLRAYVDRNVLDDLVQRALALVIDQDLKARASRGGMQAAGDHLERYLVTALRRVAATHTSWIPNSEKSRVWLGRDGLYLAWPAAADDLRRQIELEQWQGMPRTPESLLEALLTTGLAQAHRMNQPLWPIQPPRSKTPIDALKLVSALVLYGGDADVPDIAEFELTITAPALTPAPCGERAQMRANDSPTPSGTLSTTQQPAADPEQAPVTAQPAHAQEAMHPSNTQLPPPPPPLPSVRRTLRAPIRLAPNIRDALSVIIDSLNGGLLPAQCSVADGGYFIPIRIFDQLGLQAPTVVRALDEARMLLHPPSGGSPNIAGILDGETIPGVILLDRHVLVEGNDAIAKTPATATNHVAAPI